MRSLCGFYPGRFATTVLCSIQLNKLGCNELYRAINTFSSYPWHRYNHEGLFGKVTFWNSTNFVINKQFHNFYKGLHINGVTNTFNPPPPSCHVFELWRVDLCHNISWSPFTAWRHLWTALRAHSTFYQDVMCFLLLINDLHQIGPGGTPFLTFSAELERLRLFFFSKYQITRNKLGTDSEKHGTAPNHKKQTGYYRLEMVRWRFHLLLKLFLNFESVKSESWKKLGLQNFHIVKRFWTRWENIRSYNAMPSCRMYCTAHKRTNKERKKRVDICESRLSVEP